MIFDSLWTLDPCPHLTHSPSASLVPPLWLTLGFTPKKLGVFCVFFFFFFSPLDKYSHLSDHIISTNLFTFQSFLIAVVQLLSLVWLFVTSWTAARQAPLSSTISQCLLKFMSIQLVMLSNHLILCCPLLLFAFNIYQHQGLFQWVSSSHEVAEVHELQLQHQSFQWIFRAGFL